MKSSSSIVEALVLELFWCFSLSFSDPCATLVRSAGSLPAPRRRPLGPDPRAAPGRRGDGGPTGSAWPWFGYPVSPKQKPKEPVHLEDTSLHPRENPRNSPAFSLKSTSPKEVCVEQFEGLSWGRVYGGGVLVLVRKLLWALNRNPKGSCLNNMVNMKQGVVATQVTRLFVGCLLPVQSYCYFF